MPSGEGHATFAYNGKSFEEGFAAHLCERGWALFSHLPSERSTQPAALANAGNKHKVAARRRFALSPSTKRALTHGAKDGFERTTRDQEMFHFKHDSVGLVPNSATDLYRRTAVQAGGAAIDAVTVQLLDRETRDAYDVSCLKTVVSESLGSLTAQKQLFWTHWHTPTWHMFTAGSESVTGHLSDKILNCAILTDVLYSDAPSSERELKSPPVCESSAGLLTIMSSPQDVEILEGGEWIQPWIIFVAGVRRDLANVHLAVVGKQLQLATAGVVHAAVLKTKNFNSNRIKSSVNICLPAGFVVYPDVLTARTSAHLVTGSTVPFHVPELELGKRIRSRLDAPSLPPIEYAGTSQLLQLPTSILGTVVVSLDARQLAYMLAACRSIRAWNSQESLWVPIAESSGIDWTNGLPGDCANEGSQMKPQSTNWCRVLSCAIIAKEGERAINVKVIGPDGREIFFRIKRNTRLRKLTQAYSSRVHDVAFYLSHESLLVEQIKLLRFLFGTKEIGPNATAQALDMDEGDVIHAVFAEAEDAADDAVTAAEAALAAAQQEVADAEAKQEATNDDAAAATQQ